MKTDYRIVGRPFRGSRRTCHMVTGIPTREEAERKLEEGIEGGWIDPEAHVRSQQVKDGWDRGEDHTQEVRAEIEEATALGLTAIGDHN